MGGATAARLLIQQIETGTYHQDQFCRKVAAALQIVFVTVYNEKHGRETRVLPIGRI